VEGQRGWIQDAYSRSVGDDGGFSLEVHCQFGQRV
jgi:hypothetical protein